MRVVNGMKDDGLAVEDIRKAALAPVDIIRESSEEKRKERKGRVYSKRSNEGKQPLQRFKIGSRVFSHGECCVS